MIATMGMEFEGRQSPIAARTEVLIHIGYHKTGTTWLQTGIFKDEKSGFLRPWNSMLIRQQIVFPTVFDFNAQQCRTAFEPLLLEAKNRALIPVISDERLSGSPHAGGFDSALISERLSKIFPAARILIVIREQKSAIHSIYKQYVRDGGAAPLKYYLAPRNPAEIPQFRFEHFQYHHLIAKYFTLFGTENVLVLPYEWLQRSPEEFIRRIEQFTGTAIAEDSRKGIRYHSLAAATIALKRIANFFFVRNSLNPAARFYVKNHERRFERIDRFIPRVVSRPIEQRHRQFISDLAGDSYNASNRETARLIGIDLRKLGYSMNDE